MGTWSWQLHQDEGREYCRALEQSGNASDRKAEAAAAGLLVGAVGLVRGELDVRLAQAHVLGIPSLAVSQLLDVGHRLQQRCLSQQSRDDHFL